MADEIDFTHWTGSAAQRRALERIGEVSARLHAALAVATPLERPRLEAALDHLLRAETSCNLDWGEVWVPRCHADLDDAVLVLDV